MTRLTVQDMLASKKVSNGQKLLSAFPSSKLKKNEGIDELLQCLNPATFDLGCIAKNLDWLFNNTLNNIYLSCSLGTASVDPGDPNRHVSSGACYSWWGVPGLAQPQKCIAYPAATKAASTCTAKCAATGKSYEASGCDGLSLWCWCRNP